MPHGDDRKRRASVGPPFFCPASVNKTPNIRSIPCFLSPYVLTDYRVNRWPYLPLLEYCPRAFSGTMPALSWLIISQGHCDF